MFPLLPRTLAFTACLVLAGTGLLPTTTAVNEDCLSPPQEQDFTHPDGQSYLYLPADWNDERERALFGWWKETNKKPGLQTSGCTLSTGQVIYVADQKSGLLP